jgi:hypothetical protein
MRRHVLLGALATSALAILPAAAGAATDHSRPAAKTPPGAESATLVSTGLEDCVVNITKGSATIGNVPLNVMQPCFLSQTSIVQMVPDRYADVLITTDTDQPIDCCTIVTDLRFENGQWVQAAHDFGAGGDSIVKLN